MFLRGGVIIFGLPIDKLPRSFIYKIPIPLEHCALAH